ncbi:hypothetical protein Sango_2709000 [Sesamum angolense]|uniref:Uncharacterized protein n=1 Tax=Sesamum angolense TaxID=2727404 RepID=A0AAE2BHT5_9LAMI|nr:hypothetical protein Sango_2709000 [Sesamum angolense]
MQLATRSVREVLSALALYEPYSFVLRRPIAREKRAVDRERSNRASSNFVTLSNTLFDVYCSDSYTVKSLWDELDRKYKTEEQRLEEYSVSKFMRYQMVEDKHVAEQTHEIINLKHALADAGKKLPKKFLIMSIVETFLKSWESFGMTLKHQKWRLSLDDLMITISIEEEHRNQTQRSRLGRQLSIKLWEILAVLAHQEQLKVMHLYNCHQWKDSKHGKLQYCRST